MIPNRTANKAASATSEAADTGHNRPKRARSVATKPAASEAGRQTKQALLINLLQRPEGASITELVKVTGWQNHSIRGAISFALKKKLGLNVTSQRDEERGRVYRIAKLIRAAGKTKKRS